MSYIKTHNGFKILVTEGPKSFKGDIKGVSTKDKYNAHVWIHNNIVVKNHTTIFNIEIGDTIKDDDLMKSLKIASKFNL